ncbi:OmpA family protein [Pseudonocardia lacus]|uniref:OmpA family protein n=1 Tax=Pseudonocardia lacus TaxID=2835865 RepID=UPI001BDD005D|nr:OmpA family protein [Pseudonocardia lacus]
MRNRCAAVGLLLIGCTALGACALVQTPVPVDADPCAWMWEEVPDDAPHHVLLLDRSGSTRENGGSGAPDYVVALEPVLDALTSTTAVVSIGAFDGSASSVEWVGPELRTNRHRREDKQAADRPATKGCLTALLREAEATGPRRPGSDVVGALRIAAGRLGTAAERTVTVVTDGLVTVGCADLTAVAVGAPGAIAGVLDRCAGSGEFGTPLTGLAVDLVGVGHPADDQPQLSSSQLFWLAELWRTICGRGLGAARCDVSVDPVGFAPAGTRPAEPGVADPVVVFPAPDRVVTVGLDTEVLFTPNSAEISPAGRDLLAVTAADIARSGRADVVVEGYTEAQSSPQGNLDLATRRAEAVSAELAAHGVAATPHGNAGTAPGCPTAQATPTPEQRQCTRRVDIVVLPG